ncbi:MAG: cation transporter [Clostridiales bacterium]|nr:cation transporter [Clostridiales bacterium]
MIELLARWFIPHRDNTADGAVRRAYGTLCGAVGIGLNVLLFIGKFFAGQLSGSIAVTADAFNNLSDAGSSAVTLLGFRLAGKKPDPDHPFGHGRIEYISGLIVAGLILLMGVELAKSSFDKILYPEEVTFSALALVILAVSVAAKLYMWHYNRRIGGKIRSAAMEATASDSLSDAAATSAVLLAMLIGRWTGLAVDGYVGMVVALFILFSAYKAAKETLSPLLGQAPDPELVQHIRDIVEEHDTVVGIHDLVVHDYGPGRQMVSLHAEVPASGDILQLHDVIDNIERELHEKLHVQAVIHMDPIVTDDETVDALRRQVAELVRQVEPRMTVHDLRVIRGTTHTNLVFDAVLPLDAAITPAEAGRRIREKVAELDGDYYAVVTVEHSFTE